MDPKFGFTSPSLGPSKPAASASRPPRLAKLRKPLTGHRPNFTRPPSQLDADPGINSGFGSAIPYTESNVDRGFVFGSNGSSRGISSDSNLFRENLGDSSFGLSTVADEMRRLKIESEKGYSHGMYVKTGSSSNTSSTISSNLNSHVIPSVDESVVSELSYDMRRLHTGSNHLSKINGGSMEDLPNRIRGLNLKDSARDNSMNFGVGRSADESLGGSMEHKMENLNSKESFDASVNEKVYNGRFGDNTSFMFGGSGNGNEPAELIGTTNAAGSSCNHIKTDSSLCFGAVNGVQVMGNRNLQNGPGLSNAGFSFQGGLDSHNDDTHGSFRNEGNLASAQILSSGFHFKPVGMVPEIAPVNQDEKKVEFSFTSKLDSIIPEHLEFKTPDTTGNTLLGLNRKVDTKRESAKDSGLKKKKGKWKKPSQVPLKFQQEFVFPENSHDNAEISEQYSPMDLSPYEEILANNSFSRETSVASEESSHFDENKFSSEVCTNVSNDTAVEVLISATEGLCINDYDLKDTEEQDEEAIHCADNDIRVESPEEGAISGAETESFKSAVDELEYSTDSFATAAETEVSSCSKIEGQDSDGGTSFRYYTSLVDRAQGSFTFAASSSLLSESSTSRRLQKKKHQVKLGHESYNAPGIKVSPASSQLPTFQFSPLLSPDQSQKDHSAVLSSKLGKSEQVKEPGTKQGYATAASIAAQESCEKWRLRGNQAYAKGDFSRAEDLYAQGISCISQNETSRSCLRALMLCYSNRAATCMSLGRLRQALEDCLKASAIDPSFLRVQVRAASCYLSLGEVENATVHFMKCLQAGPEACADRKLLVEASEGLENTKKVSVCMKQARELLGRKTSVDVECALSMISEGLKISSYSAILLQMKVDALLMLKKYEELIQFCEHILGLVESNFLFSGVDSLPVEPHSDWKWAPSFKVWCWSLILKSYFYLGKLEESLCFLKKEEESVLLLECRESKTLESMIPLISTIRELIHHKAAGNESYKFGKYAEAVEHYTAAISCSIESRPFAAICFCNRAAAHRAMGQIIDSIADCSLAIALDGKYHKAISRRATLYEVIRDYEQAAADLQKLVSLLNNEVDKKADRVGSLNELMQTQLKLSEMEEAARNEIPLNVYLILGVDSSSAASEIKKAYRKAALKYHPDKAGQFFSRIENADDSSWKEIMEGVHRDADKLFKMIGEAYAILSDPAKRSQYDQEEEMRNAPHRGHDTTSSKIYSDFNNYMYERSSSRRHWQDVRRS